MPHLAEWVFVLPIQNSEEPERFYIGITSILSSEIDINPIFTLDTLPVALKVYETIEDLPDCPITATTLFDSGAMLTEAGDIPKVVDFEVLNLKAFADRYL